MSRPFTARYDGWCPSCRSAITEGDTIVYGDSGTMHAPPPWTRKQSGQRLSMTSGTGSQSVHTLINERER